VQLLHHTFITPIDRDEIYQLITRMDDILDLMEDVSQCLFLYDIRTIPDEAKRLAENCVACAEKVKAAVVLLHNMRPTASRSSRSAPRSTVSRPTPIIFCAMR
jgi:uncharacterized protein Yka (UPF0111/DUF47 family)